MAARIRRPRSKTIGALPIPDPQTERAIKQIVAGEKERVLPTDEALDTEAVVMTNDIRRAESLWRAAQIKAGTGLENLLGATIENA